MFYSFIVVFFLSWKKIRHQKQLCYFILQVWPFPTNPPASQRGCSESCRLKIDPCSPSRPLPSAKPLTYVDQSQPGEQSACVSSHPGLTFSPSHAVYIHQTYRTSSPFLWAFSQQNGAFYCSPLQAVLVLQLKHIADF